MPDCHIYMLHREKDDPQTALIWLSYYNEGICVKFQCLFWVSVLLHVTPFSWSRYETFSRKSHVTASQNNIMIMQEILIYNGWLITSRCSLMLNFYLIMIILYSCFYCITDRIVSSGFCLYHSRWFMATMSKQWCFKRAYRIPVSGNKHMILDHIYLKCMWPGFMSSEVKHTLVIGASMVSVHVYLVSNVELIKTWKQNQAGHWECLDLTGFQYKSLSLLQQHLLLWTLHILYPVTKLSLTRDTFQCKLHQH